MNTEENLQEDLLQLARLGLKGRSDDVRLFLRRLLKREISLPVKLRSALEDLVQERPTRSSLLRKEGINPIPVDLDSRLHLVKIEERPSIPVNPVFPPEISEQLFQLIEERRKEHTLQKQGLTPTRSALFFGEPGLGKTLAVKWLARELGIPLLTLDLAAVMSSFLGRTGNNLRFVLDYAKTSNCILFLDEFDAIAKRRDDAGEVGELKRLVTVLLQEIDEWSSSSLLVAATNHPVLLDPAVWRRFEMVIEFRKPGIEELHKMMRSLIQTDKDSEQLERWINILPAIFEGASFSEVSRVFNQLRRKSVMTDVTLSDAFAELVKEKLNTESKQKKIDIAAALVKHELLSQREAHELTGVSRDTIRKLLRETHP